MAGRQRGVLLLGLLLGLALSGLAVMVALDVWALERRRQQEQELLFVGEQYRAAIERYYLAAPKGSPRVFPSSLRDLQHDDRYPHPVRHLRRLYPDPLTGAAKWGAVMQGTRIAGIYSLGKGVPLKQAGFARGNEGFAGKSSYRDWAFVFIAPAHLPASRTNQAPPGPISPPTASP
jgi:type II secretory pathway pseudopilin PulG